MKVFIKHEQEKIGAILREYRELRNYTQDDVAEYLGVDRTTYNKYEKSRIAKFTVLLKIAAFLNIPLETIIYGCFTECNDEISPFAKASSPENDRITEIFVLDDDEKELLELYRKCIRKDEMLESARQVCKEDNKE